MEFGNDENLAIRKRVIERTKNNFNFEERYKELYKEIVFNDINIQIDKKFEIIDLDKTIIRSYLKYGNFKREYIFSIGNSLEEVFFRAKLISKMIFSLDYFGIYWEMNLETSNNNKEKAKSEMITQGQKNFLYKIKKEDPEKFKKKFDGDINSLSKEEASRLLNRLGYK